MEIETDSDISDAPDNNSDNVQTDSNNDSDEDLTRKRIKLYDSKPKPTNKKNLFKPPTTEELNYLKETESLYNSNLFRLQIDELLQQINIKKKRSAQIQLWWNEFQTFVKNLTAKDDVELVELKNKIRSDVLSPQEKFINDLRKKKINFGTEENLTLKFNKPDGVKLIGASGLNVLTRSNLQIDVSVKMPASCFREKDYLNNRYFIKRHFYTVYVLLELCKTSLVSSNIKLSYYQSNKLSPFIQLVPPFCDKIKINVYISGPENFFKPARFKPDKNNIKINLYDEFYDINANEFEASGTPMYNSLLARDFTLLQNHSHLQNSLKLKNIQDGIKLLIVWLKQREFPEFTVELLIYCVAYLAEKKKINVYMSSYQIVRIFWTFLNTTNWHKDAIGLADDIKGDVLKLYQSSYDLTFMDYSGVYNVATFFNLDLYFKLKSQAELALKILDDNKYDAFHSLFITRIPFSIQSDAILKLQNSENFNSVYKTIDKNKKWKFYGFYKLLIIDEITRVLKQALTQRITSVVPYITDQAGLNSLQFGLTLNPLHAFNVIEKGPLEDDPKSKEFRQFWKGLSDFRRFEDGTVREAVYFKTDRISERREIFQKILEFIFTNKIGPINMQVVSSEVVTLTEATPEEACLKIKSVYDDLGKKLRDLKLPLEITSMQGTSDSFSYTEVKPPKPAKYAAKDRTKLYDGRYAIFKTDEKCETESKLPKFIAPLEFVIQLGMSSKWPNDLKTLQHMKTQFYFEISKLLSEEHIILSVVKFDHLDLLYQGLIFRLKIFVPKEIQLAKKFVSNEGIVSFKDNETSLALETELDILPKVTSALHGLQMQYPSFGPSTAIIKYWIRSQLIDTSHVSDVILNLLNASTFLNGGGFDVPNLPQVAFIRFLKFLAEADWNLNPIVVNFNNDIDGANLNEMEVNFHQNRHSYTPLFIVTPYDSGKSVFTRNNPTKEILRRLTLLGKAAYEIIQNSIMDWQLLSMQKLFVPNLKGYDLLIYLLKTTISDQESVSTEAETIFPIVAFDQVQIYLQYLRKTYGKFALFFHDPYNSNSCVIGMLWKKKILEPTDFKVLNCNGMKYVDGKLELNKEALIHDFYTCGTGLIATIRKGS